MTKRESCEWTNTWWEQAEKDDLPRVLLIGDSIVCGYGSYVQKDLAGKAYVDRFATSKFASDPFLKKELALYLEEYRYHCIHFNHGLHGLDFSLEEYITAYEKLLNQMLNVCPNVILALSTPITQEGQRGILSEKNAVVVKRNDAVKSLAARYGLAVNDLYTPMLGHPEYRENDGYHYNEAGREVQGRLVAEYTEVSFLDNNTYDFVFSASAIQ